MNICNLFDKFIDKIVYPVTNWVLTIIFAVMLMFFIIAAIFYFLN